MGRAVGVGLTIFKQYRDRVFLAVARDHPVREAFLCPIEAVLVCHAEDGEGAGDRSDIADLDLAARFWARADCGGAGRRGSSRCADGCRSGRRRRCRGRCCCGRLFLAARGQETSETRAHTDRCACDTGQLQEFTPADFSADVCHLSPLAESRTMTVYPCHRSAIASSRVPLHLTREVRKGARHQLIVAPSLPAVDPE